VAGLTVPWQSTLIRENGAGQTGWYAGGEKNGRKKRKTHKDSLAATMRRTPNLERFQPENHASRANARHLIEKTQRKSEGGP